MTKSTDEIIDESFVSDIQLAMMKQAKTEGEAIGEERGFLKAVESIRDMNPFITNHMVQEGIRLGLIKKEE